MNCREDQRGARRALFAGLVALSAISLGLIANARPVGATPSGAATASNRIFIPVLMSNKLGSGGKAYFVAPNGSDGSAGSQGSPWRSISKAAAAATPGTTVYIIGGTYNEQLRPANSGTAGAWITFAAYPG
ncbi:MAG TPA: DUF1565 domain-containing protein, partial [Anaerolineae bacterium]